MIKATVRGKYKGLSHQELLDRAYELGFNYEKESTFAGSRCVRHGGSAGLCCGKVSEELGLNGST